jgi:hypothetical protein
MSGRVLLLRPDFVQAALGDEGQERQMQSPYVERYRIVRRW